MRYWSYFAAKLLVVGGVCYAAWLLLLRLIPESHAAQYYREVYNQPRFTHDLAWTFAVLGFWLFAAALAALAIWDQKRRCRTCLRRLRMPIEKGSWNHLLFLGPPRTQYICPYGHGTLEVPELQISGLEIPSWKAHDDMWKELAELDRKK